MKVASILIIDDDPVYSDMMKQRLERGGHDVSVHLGPFGATAAARRPGIDLVILDVFMPGLNGPDLLDLIRNHPQRVPIKVILCSSMDRGPLAELAAQHRADGSVPKSADRLELLSTVADVLHNETPRKNG